ncbi:MAG: hypothetical protein PHI24_12945, partial [Desulfitobacteriaceae bacterium]|nr:hypothetical protein [Desulfitobacteriaceae bacterium]
MIEVLDPETNALGLPFTSQYQYDALGRKISETNAQGVITAYQYNDAGFVIGVKLHKNAQDEGVQLKTSTYDWLGNPLTETDGEGNTITRTYNAFGKIRTESHPADSTIPAYSITYQYDKRGNVKKTLDSMGKVELFEYDNQNRVLRQTTQKADGSETILKAYRYDQNGNKCAELLGGSQADLDNKKDERKYAYDELNRLIADSVLVTALNGARHEIRKTYGYDLNDNQTSVTEWIGEQPTKTETSIYDPLNRLIEQKDAYGKTMQRLVYNHNSKQQSSFDAYNNETKYTYDKNDRLLETIDPLLHKTSQTYDEVGNIRTKTDGENNTTTYTY